MANSSAVQLADLALTWSNAVGAADLSLIDSDIASDRGLATAVLLSLFTDRRAETDDTPPSGDANDRRGWWGDQFAATAGDLFGSRLWLLARSTLTNETALRAKQYAAEALQWLVDDKVVASVAVTITRTKAGLLIAVALQRPDGSVVSFQFSHVWNNMQGDV